MRRLLVLAGLATLATGCGGKGGGQGEASPPVAASPPPAANAALALRTEVGFDPLGYVQPSPGECLQQTSAVQLPAFPQAPAIDGNFGDWTGAFGDLSDPLGDAPAAFDLTMAKVAASGDDLVFAIAYKVTPGATLNLEFGGASVVKKSVNHDLRRLFRLGDQGALQQFQNGRWQTVSAEFGVAAVGSDGTEIWLSRRLLGDVVTWPLWWVRLFTRARASGTMDATAAAYFPSLLAADQPPFTVGRCANWARRAGHVDVVEIKAMTYDKGAAADSDEAKARSTLPASLFGLMRVVLDKVAALWGKDLPLSSLAVVVGDDDWPALSNSLGVEATYSGDRDGSVSSADSSANLYRGLFFDARRFAAEAVEFFPEGLFFTEASVQLLDLVLRDSFSHAPPLVAQAVRQALVDNLLIQQFGRSYWLDRLHLDMAAFLDAPDQAKPEALSTGDASAPRRRAKAVAFGHLLSNELTAVALVKAWSAAGAAAQTEGLSVFKDTLIASCGQDTARCTRLAKLAHGWLDESTYSDTFGPAVLGDDDQDGLPNFLESRLGTDPKRSDTDGDGWSDLAEWLAATDPLFSGSHPQSLVPDGDFSDWQELLPKRLAVVNTASGQCPHAAAITFYAALATPTDLMIGAVANDFWATEPAARWEVTIDLPKENRQFLLTSTAGSREVLIHKPNQLAPFKRVYRAAPVARRSFELSIDRHMLQMKTDLSGLDAVKIRLRTIYFANKTNYLCSQTDWFVPFVPASAPGAP